MSEVYCTSKLLIVCFLWLLDNGQSYVSSLYFVFESALLVQEKISITVKGCLQREKSRPFPNLFLEDTDR